jgi:hypothetical protein
MLRFSLAFVLLVGNTDPAAASPPDPKSLVIPGEELSRARELVQLLASEQYSEREKAELELAKMGRLARPVLLEAANTNPSQEVRARCTGLLPKATALDIKARLDVFLADTEGKYEHDLPGWNQFRATIRGEWTLFGYEIIANRALDKAARSAFADLTSTHANRQVMMAADGPAAELGSIVSARRQELYYQKFPRSVVVNGMLVRPSNVRRDPTPDDIAALLFAESLVPSKVFGRAASISSLISASGFASAVNTTGDRAKVYRAIATAWLESRTDPVDMYQCMNLAGTLGLSEQGCRVAVRLLTSPGALGAYRGMAATTLARLGNKEHIPLLKKALADSAVAYTIQRRLAAKPNEIERHDVQIKDMALAVAVILSGQKIEDYGFVDAFKGNGGISGNTYSYNRYYIPDEDRKAMHEKWKAWRKSEESKGEK